MNTEKYSSPIVRVYADCTDLLLQNIARHFKFGALTSSGMWETEKLTELGELRRENIKIISQTVGYTSELAEVALEQTMLDAIAKNNPGLYAAAKQGLIATPSEGMSEGMQQILSSYSTQAANQLNLVNTVMLNSADNAMRRVISNVAALQSTLQDTTLGVLNTATGEVITGITSRQAAVRSAVKQLAAEGITGYVDASGRSWTPEAYVNMDIRTTANNVAKETVFQQMDENGLDLIIVPVNGSARPKCAPYQGRVFSRSGGSGTVKDGNGSRVSYSPLASTSYGQPDGLFGINCHHTPGDPFIPGFSSKAQEAPSQKEVKQQYQYTQWQRYLEREVKNEKRAAACYNAAGDKEAFTKAAQSIKQKSDRLKTYCDSKGLKYYSDKVQVYGYDRSVAAKASAAIKKTS